MWGEERERDREREVPGKLAGFACTESVTVTEEEQVSVNTLIMERSFFSFSFSFLSFLFDPALVGCRTLSPFLCGGQRKATYI